MTHIGFASYCNNFLEISRYVCFLEILNFGGFWFLSFSLSMIRRNNAYLSTVLQPAGEVLVIFISFYSCYFYHLFIYLFFK